MPSAEDQSGIERRSLRQVDRSETSRQNERDRRRSKPCRDWCGWTRRDRRRDETCVSTRARVSALCVGLCTFPDTLEGQSRAKDRPHLRMEDSNDRPRLRWCEELEASRAFYAKVLDPLGMKELVAREGTAGFGKTFWNFGSTIGPTCLVSIGSPAAAPCPLLSSYARSLTRASTPTLPEDLRKTQRNALRSASKVGASAPGGGA
jgi:hypothetical protein